MSSRLRLSALAVTAIAAVPVLSACDTAPGAAAIIGSDRVTTAHLQSEVNTTLAYPTAATAVTHPQQGATPLGGRAGLARETLSRLISQQLVEKVAAAHNVKLTPQDLNAERASAVQQVGTLEGVYQAAAQQYYVSPSQLNELLGYFALQQKLGTALAAALPATQAQLETEYQKDIDSYDQLDVAQIAVSSQKLGQRLLTKVRNNPSSFAALAKRYSIDTTSKAAGGEVGFVGRSQVVSLLGSAAKAKPGTFQLAHSQTQYVVLHIIKRQVTPLADVEDQVKSALYSAQSTQLLTQAITREATRLGVHVNPRYGTWSNTTQSVVAAKNPISSSG